MIYQSEICGQWLNRDEFENIFDEYMAFCDRMEDRVKSRSVRAEVDNCRRGARVFARWLDGYWASGILVRNNRVYFLGNVDSPAGAAPAAGQGAAAPAEPAPENGEGDGV